MCLRLSGLDFYLFFYIFIYLFIYFTFEDSTALFVFFFREGRWRRELLEGGCAWRKETLLVAGHEFIDN